MVCQKINGGSVLSRQQHTVACSGDRVDGFVAGRSGTQVHSECSGGNGDRRWS